MSKKQSAPEMNLNQMTGRVQGSMLTARANVEKPKNLLSTLVRLIKYIGKSKFILAGMLLMLFFVTAADTAGPYLQQKAIDSIQISEGRFQVDLENVSFYIGIMIGVSLIGGVCMYIQNVFSVKLAQQTVYYLRRDLFHHLSRLPVSYMDTHPHGNIMSVMTNDVENISNAVSQSIGDLFSSVVTIIAILIMMFHYNVILSVITLVTIPIMMAISSLLTKLIKKYFTKRAVLLGELNSNVEETVTGYKTVVAYGMEAQRLEEFTQTAEKLKHVSIFARVCGAIMGPIISFLGNMQYAILALTGGYMILSGRGGITVGGIQAMLQYSKKFMNPINLIANQYSVVLTALAGAERVFEILDEEPEWDAGTTALEPKDVRGNVRFSDIRFSYQGGEPVLKNLNLEIGAGKKIALVGATGSGKTTIINLLSRFYEIAKGEITIDGVNIQEISKENLRTITSVVLQTPVLFRDSILNNIRYGNMEASLEKVQKAAALAMADTFISRLPSGYDTMLEEDGGNLSQGQKQLLTIARAILADPRILILDEATSSVDTRTEMDIQQAMMNLMKGRTSIVIAHRLSTIRDADKIVVIKDGSIVESGNHEQLLRAKGEYYELYQKQLGGIVT